MGTIQDEIDERDTATKHRSKALVRLRTQDARYDQFGTAIYSFDDSTCSTGWHQQTDSLDHRHVITYQKTGRWPRNVGGPFITTKLELELKGTSAFSLKRLATSGWLAYSVEGTLFPHIEVQRIAKAIQEDTLRTQSVWTEDDAMSMVNLQLLGEKIMLSLVPTSAAFDAVTALGEPISDRGFFGLPGRSLLDGNPGGEFLNTVFGILPTKQDLDDFNTAVERYDKIIKQYHRDADKLIRRRTQRFSLPEEVTTVPFSTLPVTVGGRSLNANVAQAGSGTIEERINRKVWYAGAFKYHIPEGLSSFEKNLFDWQRVYGILPDPADLWNLLPFTWLSDWFTNGGNAVRHMFLQSSEGATQVYGYAMCQTEVQKTYVWRGNLRVNDVFKPCTVTAVVQKTIKQRVRVSPFGVHFTGVDLTPRQLAILAALGAAK